MALARTLGTGGQEKGTEIHSGSAIADEHSLPGVTFPDPCLEEASSAVDRAHAVAMAMRRQRNGGQTPVGEGLEDGSREIKRRLSCGESAEPVRLAFELGVERAGFFGLLKEPTNQFSFGGSQFPVDGCRHKFLPLLR